MLLLLAHQGGWDELLWFLVPAVVVLTWVRWAKRRARTRQPRVKDGRSSMPDESDA